MATLKRGSLPLLAGGLGLVVVAIWLLAAPKPEVPVTRPPAPAETATTTPAPLTTASSAELADTASPSHGDAPPTFPDGLKYTGPVKDRVRADALREALVALYAGQLAAQEAQTGGAANSPMPAPEGTGNQANKAQGRYIAEVMREQFVPLASSCYEQLLELKPEASGDIELVFSIMGDAAVGGVVVDAELGPGTTIADASFATCIRESMLSVVFAPPPAGHPTISVVQSLTLEP